jgi:hypothetical protein
MIHSSKFIPLKDVRHIISVPIPLIHGKFPGKAHQVTLLPPDRSLIDAPKSMNSLDKSLIDASKSMFSPDKSLIGVPESTFSLEKSLIGAPADTIPYPDFKIK